MNRPTKATVRQRVEDILRIRLDGAEMWDCREYVKEQSQEKDSAWFGDKCLSDAQIYRYMARADKLIAESCRTSRKRLMRRHLAQRRNLYAKAVSQGDMRTALSVLHDEAELLHLYDEPITAQEVGAGRAGDGPDWSKLTQDERQTIERILIAAASRVADRPPERVPDAIT